ncbi:thrombospondin type 3 repeat-containing protein, partial [Actinokineospora sp.]|uniref:thrombospondin type 3 repeat-containing protein n=1 Tax=Actinokineospora sp. TaxID=1872133 RepID=UPI003D6BF0B9
YASAELTGVGALIRDYFAQGFYPTGARVDADRLPNVSGPLVKAMVAASANFLEELGTSYPTPNDQAVGFARAVNLPNVSGVNVGIIGNSEQGYGRPVVTSVLPLANWPTSKGVGINNTLEYPAAGLLVFDEVGTGELAISNTRTSIEHTFTVDSDSTRTVLIGGVSAKIVDRGQLRIAVAWSDPPSGPGTAGALVNDLDLEVESPGPDGTLSSTTDNIIYDGNNYQQGTIKQGQWSLGRTPAGTDLGDRRNPIEAVHLSADANGDGSVADSQLFVGTWRVRVKRGAGGATAGQITVLTGAREDANNNGRLDPGEDSAPAGDGDGFLDADGQPYGLVIAGPVIGSGSQTFNGASHAFPASVARLNKSLYGCADEARLTVFDPGTTATAVAAAVTFEVVSRGGVVVDQERGLPFTASASNTYASGGIPVRDGRPAAIRFNGILETNGPGLEEPYSVRARYADTPREVLAAARISCSPNLVAWRFLGIPNENGTQQVAIGGGCDQDQFMDSGENVTYSLTFGNSNRDHDLTDVQATLAVGGPGAGAVRVLNSPQNLGRIPGGQITAATFILRIDPAALALIAVNNRIVDVTVTLRASTGNVQLERQAFAFRHALNSDYETFHYSTDHPGGAREIRDFNRNLQIDTPDLIDPFIGIQIPDEDVTFSSMFIPGTAGGVVTNILGEDLNNNGALDTATERDIIPNGALDRGIVASASGPTPGVDKAPFTFDSNSGGFAGFRSAFSRPGGSAAQVWEYVRSGVCGFQTAIPDGDPANGFQNDGAGIWHTGDGSPATPTTSCENHAIASEAATPPGQEFFQDFLVSPIIAKVHQTADSRGLPYTVEFQRLGYNTMVQTVDDQPGGNLNIDNNVDDDGPNCLLCQDFDFRYGGIDYLVAGWVNSGDAGTCPACVGIPQRTFGLTIDPDGSLGGGNKSLTGDETGFTAFTQNTNILSSSPIPEAGPALLPYPLPDAPTVFAPDGVTPWTNDVAGPVRNFDLTLINYAAGFNSLMQGSTGQEVPSVTPFDVNPGVRWQVGFGFFHIEGGANVADYGIGVDDVVFEWDERHPVDEAALGHAAACQRFGQPGQAAGAQCATLSVDRGGLFECEDALLVSVYDPKRAGAGSVEVLAASDSDARPFSTGVVTALHPVKRFTLAEVSGSPGMFTGPIVASQAINAPNTLFVSPATDNFVQVYYQDPQCDGNRTGVAGQNDFDNLDGDGVAFGADSCPFDYNPSQGDPDGDGRGDGTVAGEMGCDNCPGVANADQLDSDGDRVGDACDLDDIDFDGIVNTVDNCLDVYNPLQAPGGPSGKGLACDKTTDRDGDGFNDRLDKCVRTPNPLQEDADQDGIGDACEGDCLGARRAELAIGSCSRSSAVECSAADPACPTTGICQEDLSRVCTSSGPQCTCINIAPEACVLTGTINDTPRTCSIRDDDTDVDSVADAVDNCPVKTNLPVVPGTSRQADGDNDNIGDACDSPFMVDGDNSGLPDDVVSFSLVVNCGKVPLPTLVVERVDVVDLNGDLDVFCDTGERCEMTMTVFNASPINLTDVTLFLATSDSDIQCVTRSSVNIGTLAAGTKVNTANIGGQRRAFEFVMSPTSETTDAAQPLKGDFNLALISRESIGTRNKVGFQILLDLDLPEGVVVQRVLGPDGTGNTSDDGLLFENFDIDRDGVGGVDISDGREGIANDTFGVTVGSALGGINVIAGIGCGGYKIPPIDPGCRIDPDNDMSWHVHCPTGTCPQPHAVSAKGNL